MDVLQELIWSLNEKEKKLFQKYIQHKSNKNQRKDLHIFNYLWTTDQPDTKTIVEELYPIYSKKYANTYHSLRNYLKDQLESFILQQKDIGNNQLQISRLINLAQKLYFHKKYQLAWYYLEAAEEIAIKAEEYELLNQVYQHMVEFAWTQPPHIFEKVVKKESENREQAQIRRAMNLALSAIRNRISFYYPKAEKPNVENIVQRTLEEFGVNRIVAQKASERYKLAMIIKVSLEEKGNYEELYKYIIQTIHEMEEAKLFDKYNYRYRIELLNLISYISIRIEDYEIAEKYIRIVEEEIKMYPDADIIVIESYIAKSIYFAHTNRKLEGLEILESLKIKFKKTYNHDDYLFTRLNLNIACMHLHLGNTSIPRKCLNELLNHSYRIIRSHGLEMLFYCHTSECLLAIEADDLDYAFSRVQAIERKYKKLLQQSHHMRNNEFIKILRFIIYNSEPWKQEEFRNKLWKFIELKPLYMPGYEFISFNAWLYSRLENVSYNEGEYNKAIKEKMKNGELKMKE